MNPRTGLARVAFGVAVLGLAGGLVWLARDARRRAEAVVPIAPIGPTRVKPRIAVSGSEAVVLAADGTLWGWGANWTSPSPSAPGMRAAPVLPRRISPDSDWLLVACGPNGTVALKTNHALWAWKPARYSWLSDLKDAPGPRQVGTATNWQAIT
ncbi:MAG: hypothetical protein KGS61_21585, partial [Verrucomicrobia bacterium]|nr:hypothetical protein [Verrucomicrobiota bacterium]